MKIITKQNEVNTFVMDRTYEKPSFLLNKEFKNNCVLTFNLS